jgi:3-isopropylmalate/(R)-2-methylmalate dehydratase small subunit
MERIIQGKVFVVGDNIDTDQIIPAEFLSYNPAEQEERKFFGRYAMSGVPSAGSGLPGGGVKFTAEDSFRSEFSIIVAGRNFGCGSSREHAPLALAEAGCSVVIAESYARIFFRNCVNGGYCAPFETKPRLVEEFSTGDQARLDTQTGLLKNLTTGRDYQLESLGDVAEIIEAGGVFEYAKTAGMLR